MKGDFSERLSMLCAGEMPHARRDEVRMAEMIGRLTHALGLSIAIATKGDAKFADMLLTGVEQQLVEVVSAHAPIGKLMAGRK